MSRSSKINALLLASALALGAFVKTALPVENPTNATQTALWFTDASLDGTGTNVLISVQSLEKLASAAVVTNDVRDLTYAYIWQVWATYQNMTNSLRPAKMTPARSVRFDAATTTVVETISFTFVNDVTVGGVSDED